MSSAGDSEKFERTDAKLHVPVVTLSTKDSANLRKQLNEGFKRTVYLNSYKKKPAKVIEKEKNLYKILNASFQGVKRLFVLAYVIASPLENTTSADDTAGIKKIESISSQEERLTITRY